MDTLPILKISGKKCDVVTALYSHGFDPLFQCVTPGVGHTFKKRVSTNVHAVGHNVTHSKGQNSIDHRAKASIAKRARYSGLTLSKPDAVRTEKLQVLQPGTMPMDRQIALRYWLKRHFADPQALRLHLRRPNYRD